MSKTWFITGAARGLGAAIAEAAMATGDRVVATGRRRDAVAERLGPDGEGLLSLTLDVTREPQARDAVAAAVERFGSIDVLVNNAGYGHLGIFKETTDPDARAQYDTNVSGVLNVTRAVLPVMRRQRAGHVFNLSSLGGLLGGEAGALYCATKFAVDGSSESIAKEVAPFGIRVTIVEPGFFRTDFLDPSSVRLAPGTVDDYAEMSAGLRAFWTQRSGHQAGDPAKLGRVIVELAGRPDAPLRFAAGSDAVAVVEGKIASLRAELDAWRELSVTTDGDYAPEVQSARAGTLG